MSSSTGSNSSVSGRDGSESSTSGSCSIHSASSNECHSSTTASDSESSQHETLLPTSHRLPIHDAYAMKTLQWTIQMPVGLGLCPWAIQSYHRSLLEIVTCPAVTPCDVARRMEKEMHRLFTTIPSHEHQEERVALRTTLVVCPNVNEWKEDFDCFDEFVKSSMQQYLLPSTTNHDMFHDVTLVAFHPKFDRWHALPEDVGVGSVIHSHWSDMGKKSRETAEAVIVEMGNRAFGMRRVKVRFEHDGIGRRREEYVPTDWIVLPQTLSQQHEHERMEQCGWNPLLPRLLPDNAMYRSPYPTIHIIDNRDLASLCVADVSRVKRLNARRMMRLRWEGLEKHMEKTKLDNKGGS